MGPADVGLHLDLADSDHLVRLVSTRLLVKHRRAERFPGLRQFVVFLPHLAEFNHDNADIQFGQGTARTIVCHVVHGLEGQNGGSGFPNEQANADLGELGEVVPPGRNPTLNGPPVEPRVLGQLLVVEGLAGVSLEHR